MNHHPDILTLSRAQRLRHRGAPPAIGTQALDAAPRLDARPRDHRTAPGTAAGPRRANQPEPSAHGPGRPRPRRPQETGRLAAALLGHGGKAHLLYRILHRAGFRDPAALAAASGDEPAALRPLSPRRVLWIRARTGEAAAP